MAWRGAHPTFLLVLLAACLPWARGQTPFSGFQRQHVDFPRTGGESTKAYCNRLMQERGLTWPLCKRTNTFVHEEFNAIVDVCGHRGTPVGEKLRDSHAYFDLTLCLLQGGSQTPPCNYKENTSTQSIRIACDERGKPVHFEE